MVATLGGLFVATFVSEDLACVAAGVLIARGDVPLVAGVAACALGIFIGDLGLWTIGRCCGRAALVHTRVTRWLTMERVERSRAWLERHAAAAILASRFTPGARLPLYVTAGIVRMSPLRFAAWTLIAAVLWTPVAVLASAQAGRVTDGTGAGAFWGLAAAALATVATSRAARLVWSPAARRGVAAAIRRLGRWEFWPSWLFYAPVAVWVAVLAVRHRGLGAITTSNPGIADGGVVGESKFDILRRLPGEWTIPFVRVPIDAGPARERAAAGAIAARGWTYPLIVKPDVGQRGAGVRLLRSPEQLRAYLGESRGDVLVQPYHAGPFEAGIFYYRFPGRERGRIFSITDKQFPAIVGDGTSTVAALIHAHPRYRLQASLFLHRHRHAADTVLAAGERLQLAIAGNHAQGTMFRDGRHLWTEALEQRIDAIARRCPGFFIGRFDVRYHDVEAFKAGRDLAIVELNGATAESTNIYDPDASLLDAYRVLFRQWSLVFAIGAANRARGATPTTHGRLAALLFTHLTTAPPLPISD